MGKGSRNRTIRKQAMATTPKRSRSVARALRRHGRMPLDKSKGQA